MKRRDALAACSLGALLGPVSLARASAGRPRVVFLNPGEAVEHGTGQHWQLVSEFMGIAARSFDMRLDVVYAERDHLLMLRQAEEVARRADPPDYVVIVNEKMAAQQMLQLLARSSSKVVVIHNDVTARQRREIGDERQAIQNWIGTVTANAASGGYRLMSYLCGRLAGEPARVIGITGDPNTPVSQERASGVDAFLSRAGGSRMYQLVFSDWSYADSEEKTRVLLARYRDTNLVWAANDSMALGALSAVRSRGARVLVGGMGALPGALRSVAEGGLAAMVGGDYFIGAWAMVLLYDYHHGKDFAASGGARQTLDFLSVVHQGNVERFSQAIFDHGDELDFTMFSKVRHPEPGPYDFSLARLVGPFAGSG
ncbi:ABC transporter substrate-binding protein [Paraburkholderia sp. 22098]|uniref:ABC transporter substrate-binding protein n=1 Tax=Paraburkholderia sp. 22098 TaxID=3453874 RepID=UPI003F8523AA